MSATVTKGVLVSLALRLRARERPQKAIDDHVVARMSTDEIAALKALAKAERTRQDVIDMTERIPFPSSQREVKRVMGWGSARAMEALREYRKQVTS